MTVLAADAAPPASPSPEPGPPLPIDAGPVTSDDPPAATPADDAALQALVPAPAGAADPPLSKNQLKKLKRYEAKKVRDFFVKRGA